MAFPCFQLLYMTLAVNIIDGRGLINAERREHLPKKAKVTWYWVIPYQINMKLT